MKTKILVIVLSVVAVISFTALTTSKGHSNAKNNNQSYQSSGGQTMSDPHQFD